MRNAFDDFYANSLAFKEAERLRRESRELLSVRPQAIIDLVPGQTSTRWNDLGKQNALKMSGLVRGIDLVRATQAGRSLVADLQSVSKMSEGILGSFHKSFLSAEAANSSIAKILTDTQVGIKFSHLESIISKEWMIPRESFAKGLIEATGLKTLETSLNSIAAMSSIAETFTRNIQETQIGGLLGISNKISTSLAVGFAGFSKSYERLFDSFEKNNQCILAFRPSLVRMPTIEYYNAAVLTRSVSSDEIDDFDIADDGDSESLEYFLVRLDPDLLQLLRGARKALTSSNPDRVRHFSASLRELLTHVVHMLAPEDAVRNWSTSPEDFPNGKPSRSARLRYICREIDHAPFGGFVKRDIDAVLEFFQLFHAGTHAVASKFTERQVKALQIRVESSLRFLCEISSSED